MKTATEVRARYMQSESRIWRYQQEVASVCPQMFNYIGAVTGRYSRPIVWTQPPGEGKKHSYEMRRAMKQGMSLERALELQLEHVRDRGETLEGYMARFKPLFPLDAQRVRRMWEADTEYLNVLVRAALLKNTGHSPGDVETILKNRAFFEQVRTKGVTR